MSYQNLIQHNKAGAVRFVKQNRWKLFLGLLIFICLYCYFMYIYKRIPRRLKRITPYFQELELHPVSSCPKLLANKYLLCDFYVASSYRSYLPYCQYYDYSSLAMLNKVLLGGARFIELDVYNRGFCEETVPVVCMGREMGNWHYTTELEFTDCIGLISQNAFNSRLTNHNDPFFLCLNLYLDGNQLTMNKMAKTIRRYMGDWLLDNRYSYQRTNIAQVEISELLHKVIIITNNRCQGTEMAELINYTWFQPFLRNYSHYKIEDLYEPQELTDFNRRNLTRVYPGFTGRNTENYNPRPSWMYGCQFVCMNYGRMDINMLIYLKKFKKSSFVLKPYKLRFHPNYYKSPTPQTKKVSFAPEQISTPNFSITY